MQGLIDNMHTQFIQAVADGRKMKAEDIRAIANGKVWTGEQALHMKLIDQVGDFRDCGRGHRQVGGNSGEPTLVRPDKDRKTVLDLLFGDVSGWTADPREADGPACRVLLPVEVEADAGTPASIIALAQNP